MANTIQLRRSAVQGAVPTTTQIQLGELAINTYDGKLYLKKNVNGTESIVQVGGTANTLAVGRQINGTLFDGSADIVTSYWGSTRTITIGGTGKSVNGSANVSWTTTEIGAEYQAPLGVPRANLGDPTVREMAVFDTQFNNKTELYDINNLFFETSTDNVTWTNYAVTDSQKRIFLTGDSNATIAIPNGTAYFRIRLRATSYVYLNSLYIYHTSGGHSTQIKAYKKHDNDAGWTQHTNSTVSVGSWPGHIHLPFNTIPFNPTAAQGSHFHEVYFLFIPTWNPSWPAQNITLHKFQLWGGYPAGKRNIYATDELGGVTFPNSLAAAVDLVSNFSSGDEGGQIRLNKAATNTTLNTGVTIDVYQNKLRIFETGGTSRGVYVDLSSTAAGANTNLLAGSGTTSMARTFMLMGC